jgi:integrase/recombinase XerD
VTYTRPTSTAKLDWMHATCVANLDRASQTGHLRARKRFSGWLARSPVTARPVDVEGFQQHLIESGMSICTRSQTMTGAKYLFRLTLDTSERPPTTKIDELLPSNYQAMIDEQKAGAEKAT